MSALRLATWNVNGIRARMERFLAWLDHHHPEIVCLQETKVEDSLFPLEPLAQRGYQVAFSGQKGFNGVAILSTAPIHQPLAGFEPGVDEPEKRILSATTHNIRVISAYIPNGQAVGSDKFAFKLAWLARLTDWLGQHHTPAEPLALCGDFNVAPAPEDVYSVEAMEGEVGFHPQERKALERLRNWGFVDQFRAFHPEPHLFSWWDYRAGSFQKNKGLRIDHIWTSPPLAALATGCDIQRQEREGEKPSDHVPVVAVFENSLG
ncbi:MAG: exodeoxyribonuclease III [Deltaproteobacteria bacterium]|nr:exodeoxyribonuclease III [Deltaproteobacteria bacterium]